MWRKTATIHGGVEAQETAIMLAAGIFDRTLLAIFLKRLQEEEKTIYLTRGNSDFQPGATAEGTWSPM